MNILHQMGHNEIKGSQVVTATNNRLKTENRKSENTHPKSLKDHMNALR